MTHSRKARTLIRVVEDELRAQGHKHPRLAAEMAADVGLGICRHARTYQVTQTSLFGPDELQTICARCSSILSVKEAA